MKYTKDWTDLIAEKYDIGLVPMSAKPFHEGHMSLVRKASDELNSQAEKLIQQL